MAIVYVFNSEGSFLISTDFNEIPNILSNYPVGSFAVVAWKHGCNFYENHPVNRKGEKCERWWDTPKSIPPAVYVNLHLLGVNIEPN